LKSSRVGESESRKVRQENLRIGESESRRVQGPVQHGTLEEYNGELVGSRTVQPGREVTPLLGDSES